MIFDRAPAPGSSLDAVDNVTVNALGDVFVCEDGGNLEIGLISRENTVSPFLRLPGSDHADSEICGACFDPSGTRLYFTSQRASSRGGLPGRARSTRSAGRSGCRGAASRRTSSTARPPARCGPTARSIRAPTVARRARDRCSARIGARRLMAPRTPRRPHLRRAGPPCRRLALVELRQRASRAGTIRRPRSVSLAESPLGEETIERGLGPRRVHLELDETARRKLRRRAARTNKPLAARLFAVAVDGAGNRSAEVLEIEIRTR